MTIDLQVRNRKTRFRRFVVCQPFIISFVLSNRWEETASVCKDLDEIGLFVWNKTKKYVLAFSGNEVVFGYDVLIDKSDTTVFDVLYIFTWALVGGN